ncbi:hypothetical protein M8J75_010701 [Diaphorina citri]|nr:hypothetical protein M8J75_010701 [Diaphorina citri]
MGRGKKFEIHKKTHITLQTCGVWTRGYYTFDQKKSKVRLVALNTNLFSNNPLNSKEELEAQWKWFETIMTKSEKNNERVFIIGHMAPGADEKQFDALPSFSEKYSTKYLRLIRKHAAIIVGQFFGHLHSDTFRIVYDDNKPVSWMMMAPSVSPRRIPIGNNNPGIRIYKYDTVTGAVLDFSQYYLDLSEANAKNEAVWQLEYNLTSYYGLNELSPRSLHELAQSFTLSNSLLFERYHRAYAVNFNHHYQHCDSNCRHTHYCAITKLEFSDFRNCLETAAHALASSNNHQQRNAQLASLLLVVPFVLGRLI